MGIHRSELRRRRRSDAVATRARNGLNKERERARRDQRMMTKIQQGDLPYTPAVMSWLSRQLDKKATKITTQDVKALNT